MGVLLAETGYKAGLEVALAETDTLDAQREQKQADLFAQPGEGASSSSPAEVGVRLRGPGRPIGSRNKRTDEMSRIYLTMIGRDPLYGCTKAASIDITTKEGREELKEIGRDFGVAADKLLNFWLGCVNSALPYIHQRLATLTVKPAGSPEGEAVVLPWAYDEDNIGDVLELVHDRPQSDAE